MFVLVLLGLFTCSFAFVGLILVHGTVTNVLVFFEADPKQLTQSVTFAKRFSDEVGERLYFK